MGLFRPTFWYNIIESQPLKRLVIHLISSLMTNVTSYDILVINGIVLYPMGFVLDFWEEIVFYKHGW
jgi:hypothetical protein